MSLSFLSYIKEKLWSIIISDSWNTADFYRENQLPSLLYICLKAFTFQIIPYCHISHFPVVSIFQNCVDISCLFGFLFLFPFFQFGAWRILGGMEIKRSLTGNLYFLTKGKFTKNICWVYSNGQILTFVLSIYLSFFFFPSLMNVKFLGRSLDSIKNIKYVYNIHDPLLQAWETWKLFYFYRQKHI